MVSYKTIIIGGCAVGGDVLDKHLWEVKHDYYCEEENYYKSGTCVEYASFTAFLREFGKADFDMNLLFRWDWQDHTNEWYSEDIDHDLLFIFWMGQRKGMYFASKILIEKEDEARVIEFLKPRFEHLMKLWQPFTTDNKSPVSEA